MANKIRIKIEGLEKLQKALVKQGARAIFFHTSSGVVGYGTKYGIYVHEDMQKPPKTGNRKFLTGAEKLIRPHYLKEIAAFLKKIPKDAPLDAKPIFEAMCNYIKITSQQLVPVQTGKLRDSAFSRAEISEDVSHVNKITGV